LVIHWQNLLNINQFRTQTEPTYCIQYKKSYLGLYIFGLYTQSTYVYDLKGYRSKVTHIWHDFLYA